MAIPLTSHSLSPPPVLGLWWHYRVRDKGYQTLNFWLPGLPGRTIENAFVTVIARILTKNLEERDFSLQTFT